MISGQQGASSPTRDIVSSIRTLRVPVSSGVLLVFFGFLLLILSLSSRVLGDSDTYWHIAAGRWIWENGALPRTDEFSHTFAGQPWIAKEWLAQLILYAAFRLGSWAGVVILTAVVVAGSFAGLYAWLSGRLAAVPAFILTTFAFVFASGGILARPHMFFLAILVLFVAELARALEQGGTNPPWRALPLLVLWANLHASFTLGLVIAAILALEAFGRAPRAQLVETVIRWALFGLAGGLAVCVTPYGAEPIMIGVNVFEGIESVQYISEWQPLARDPRGIFSVTIAAAFLGILFLQPVRNGARILVVALCGYLMMKHLRFGLPFGVVASILVAGPLAAAMPRLVAGQGSSASDRERAAIRLSSAGCALACVLALFINPPGPRQTVAPIAALGAARAMGVTGPVLNSYEFGGYLILSGIKTFIDGRTDQLFLGGFMDQVYSRKGNDAPERLARLMERHGVTWALLHAGSSQAEMVSKMPGWSKRYEDAQAVVLVRDPDEQR